MENLQTEFCLNQQYASLFSGICFAKKYVENEIIDVYLQPDSIGLFGLLHNMLKIK